jgi:hypothetical protein
MAIEDHPAEIIHQQFGRKARAALVKIPAHTTLGVTLGENLQRQLGSQAAVTLGSPPLRDSAKEWACCRWSDSEIHVNALAPHRQFFSRAVPCARVLHDQVDKVSVGPHDALNRDRARLPQLIAINLECRWHGLILQSGDGDAFQEPSRCKAQRTMVATVSSKVPPDHGS